MRQVRHIVRHGLVALVLLSTAKYPETHALYIGMAEFAHASGSRQATLRVRVFYDDLQSAARALAPKQFKAGTPAQWPSQNKRLIEQYLQKHLWCVIDGKKTVPVLKTVALEGEVYWVELEAACVPSWKTLDIHADFLMELFPDQSNVVQVVHGSVKRFARTTRAERQVRFEF